MKLWKIADQGEFLALKKDGRLVTDGRRIDRDFRAAYRWMSRQMIRRIGPGPDRASFPQWAWLHWRGPNRKRPDLRSIRHHLPPGTYFLLDLKIDDGRVLVSDFERWHFVLNGWYLPSSENDAAEFSPGKAKERRAAIEKSWDAIFDISAPIDETLWGSPDTRSLQATFWELNFKDVRSVFQFDSVLSSPA